VVVVLKVSDIKGIEEIAKIEKEIRDDMKKLFEEEISHNITYLSRAETHYRHKAVAVDASNIKIELEYTDACYIKCADDEGNVYLNIVVPTDLPEKAWINYKEKLKNEEPVIKFFFDFLSLTTWEDLTYIGGSNDEDQDSFVKILRDVTEWAVLVRVLTEEKRCIVLKDGLLRNKVIKYVKSNPNSAYVVLKEKIKELCQNRNNVLVGIAKSGKLINIVKDIIRPYFEEYFTRPFAIRIPNSSRIMELSYNYIRYREGEISFGDNLYIVSFLEKPRLDNLCMIEIPGWQEDRAVEIIQVLYTIGIRKLPLHTIGLPIPIAHAHEQSKVTHLVSNLIATEIKRNLKS